MNVLVIPTTDWTQHPIPNRLNFIFDRIAERHNVHVLHFHYDKYLNNIPRKTKCNLIDAGHSGDDISKFYLSHFAYHRKLINKVIRESEIDVILSANILPSYIATHTNVPIIYDYLDVMDEAAAAYLTGFKKELAQFFVRKLMKKIIGSAKEVITVSPSLAQYHIAGRYGRNIQNTVVIPNGVDCNVFKPYGREEGRFLCGVENDLPIIGYVGSIERWVDFDMVIRAMDSIHANLVVVGGSLHTDEMHRIKKLAEQFGNRIKFKGFVPYEQLPRYISGFDVGINPLTKTEHNIYSAGGKIFNYLACGIPVVSSECDPGSLAKDMIYIYHGWDDYVGKIYRSLEFDRKYPHRAKERERIAQYYDWDKLSLKYEEVLLRVSK